jgi:hypothetical protein
VALGIHLETRVFREPFGSHGMAVAENKQGVREDPWVS